MTLLPQILDEIERSLDEPVQRDWFHKLSGKYSAGKDVFRHKGRELEGIWINFINRITTEMFKASLTFSKPLRLFQGTSITSIIRPVRTKTPLSFSNLDELASHIAANYIKEQEDICESVTSASLDNTEGWYHQGYFFSVVVSSKLISQCLGLVAPIADVMFKVNGTVVDPHNLSEYADSIREKYLEMLKRRISFFAEESWIDSDILSSVILADITRPNITRFADKLILAPVHSNEIASFLSRRIQIRVIEKSKRRINPKSISVIIFDTDSPFSYHAVNNYRMDNGAPILPGLTLLGISGSIKALQWLYAYRMAIISQFHMPGINCSSVMKEYVPYVFFGVIHPRNYYLLVNPENLGLLRYRGNVNPRIEFFYTIADMQKESERKNKLVENDEARFDMTE